MRDSLSIIPLFCVLLNHFPHVSAIITPFLFILNSTFAAEILINITYDTKNYIISANGTHAASYPSNSS